MATTPKCQIGWTGGRAVLSEARSKLIVEDLRYNRGGGPSIFSLTPPQFAALKTLFGTTTDAREDVIDFIDDNALPMDV